MRVYDKIEEIETYLNELLEIIPVSFEKYKTDFKSRAACERYFEKIIEAIIDLAFLVIKDKKLRIPEEDAEVFDILSKEGIISKELAKRFREAKGMRNIIAHEYGKIDDEIVFHSITEELEKDAKELIYIIKKELK